MSDFPPISLSRRDFLIAASAVAVAGPAHARSEGGRFLVREGMAAASIHVAPSQAAALAAAVAELQHHLKAMSGTELPVVESADPAVIAGSAIVLGDLAHRLGAQPAPASRSRENFHILSSGDRLLIGGGSDDGVLFGVYRLLEELGCEWVMPGAIGEVVPRRAAVPIPRLDVSEAPAFAYRRLWYGGSRDIVSKADKARFDQWLLRQRRGEKPTPATQTAGHMWSGFIRRHRAEFEADPTMYALRPGPNGPERRGPQIETTHPRVIELMVEDIKAQFRGRGWPHDHEVGFPIGPSDGLGFSISPESIAAGSGRIDPVSGDPDVTDLIVLLGNRILERLGDEYPNVHLGFYSYSVHSSFPSRYTPHPRLVPIFAPISYSRFHSLTDESSPSQRIYKAELDQWGALAQRQGNRMLFRGYNWNLADNMLPYSKARIWGEELPYYAAMGVEGLNVEATKAWSINGPHDWIFMKLAWNPSRDWRALLARYCDKSYGAGAEPMRRHFLRLIDRQHGAGQEAGSYHSFPLIYDRAFIAAAMADVAEAGRLAREESERTRIGYVGLGVEALRLYLDYFDASVRFDFAEALRHYDAMHTHWRRSYELNPDIVAKEAPEHLERFIGPFVRDAAARSSGDYRLVLPLPDQLPMVLDPKREGLERSWHREPFAEGAAAVTKTYSSTWSAQRLKPEDSVWYQHRFRLPEEAGGKPIGLFLGGFDDEARVWLNGKEIGTSGRQFSRPAEFDLIAAIEKDGDNLLAIEIVRNVALNELGVGGLFRPSFLYTGPHIGG